MWSIRINTGTKGKEKKREVNEWALSTKEAGRVELRQRCGRLFGLVCVRCLPHRRLQQALPPVYAIGKQAKERKAWEDAVQ